MKPRTASGRRLLRWPSLRDGVYAITEGALRNHILAVEAEAARIDPERLGRAMIAACQSLGWPNLNTLSSMRVAAAIAAAYGADR